MICPEDFPLNFNTIRIFFSRIDEPLQTFIFKDQVNPENHGDPEFKSLVKRLIYT